MPGSSDAIEFLFCLAKEDVFRTKRSDEDTSDEEKQWLDALEKGNLDDKGELRKNTDISLMTARQVRDGEIVDGFC